MKRSNHVQSNHVQSNIPSAKWIYGNEPPAHLGRKSANSNAMEGWRKVIPAKRADVKTVLGIGSFGLVVQILALIVLVTPLIFMIWLLPMMSQEVSTAATVTSFIVCGVTAFGLMSLGFAIARPYVNEHVGAHFAVGVFSNIIPILIGFAVCVLPFVLAFG